MSDYRLVDVGRGMRRRCSNMELSPQQEFTLESSDDVLIGCPRVRRYTWHQQPPADNDNGACT
eukprot:scaffold172075_cov65-Cyclotella_meneghiniana.AAC.1